MNRPRFLADEDLRHSIVQAIRRLEPQLVITTIIEAGLSSASDVEVLEYASQHHPQNRPTRLITNGASLKKVV